ncbi:MAG: ABC transporter permease [Phototrophicaceae bacterium]
MGAFLAVYKREVALYYKSFIAYGITFALMILMGLLFQAQLSGIFNIIQQGQQVPANANAANLAVSQLDTFVFLMFVVSPVLVMRLLSEESREGTLEVLMTLPMSDWTFVVGKFLAAWTFYTFLLALTLIHVWLLSLLGPINYGVIGVAYFGAWLYGGTTMAICMIWSAVTDDQLVAAFLGVTTVLALFLASDLGQIFEGNVLAANASEFVRELGLRTHYQATMLDGLLRAEDVAYFVLMIAVSLFITTLIVGTRRWRAS